MSIRKFIDMFFPRNVVETFSVEHDLRYIAMRQESLAREYAMRGEAEAALAASCERTARDIIASARQNALTAGCMPR